MPALLQEESPKEFLNRHFARFSSEELGKLTYTGRVLFSMECVRRTLPVFGEYRVIQALIQELLNVTQDGFDGFLVEGSRVKLHMLSLELDYCVSCFSCTEPATRGVSAARDAIEVALYQCPYGKNLVEDIARAAALALSGLRLGSRTNTMEQKFTTERNAQALILRKLLANSNYHERNGR